MNFLKTMLWDVRPGWLAATVYLRVSFYLMASYGLRWDVLLLNLRGKTYAGAAIAGQLSVKSSWAEWRWFILLSWSNWSRHTERTEK